MLIIVHSLKAILRFSYLLRNNTSLTRAGISYPITLSPKSCVRTHRTRKDESLTGKLLPGAVIRQRVYNGRHATSILSKPEIDLTAIRSNPRKRGALDISSGIFLGDALEYEEVVNSVSDATMYLDIPKAFWFVTIVSSPPNSRVLN